MARTDQLTDAVYVERCLAGEPAAFQELVSRYTNAVMALVMSHLGRTADVDDVAQEVFFQAYRSLPTLRAHDRFGPWLYGIGKRTCLNQLRQRKNREELLTELRGRVDPDAEESSDLSGHVDLRLDILDAVRSLPEIYREVILQRYIEEKSYGEIARFLGITESAVNVRLIKARRMMRDRWTRAEVD